MNCTIEWEINGWIIAWLCTLKEMEFVALIMRLSYNNFKIWKPVEGNCKFYVFACFFIVIIVNIWISFFIRLCNLFFLRNTLRKFFGATTIPKEFMLVVLPKHPYIWVGLATYNLIGIKMKIVLHLKFWNLDWPG